MDAISPSILLLLGDLASLAPGLSVGETMSYSNDCLGVGNSIMQGDF
jgi:hypothetical protein